MSAAHEQHHYSITFRSDDLAVVGCLRALAQHCQKTGNARIAYGNTKRPDWLRAGKKVTFHFTDPSYRDDLVHEASRLLPSSLFEVVGQRDDHPATPAKEEA